MAVEIRSCRDQEEMQRYSDITAYVFAANERAEVDIEVKATEPAWTTCAFVDDKMATTMGGIPWDVRLNGNPVPMAGVTAVGTLPTHRRRGLLRKVMYGGFAKWHDEGRNFAILWASMAAIYQRFGYGHAAPFVKYSFDPREAAFAFPTEPPGSISLKTPVEARPEMEALYVPYIAPKNLAVHRDQFLWDSSALRPRKKGEPVYVAIYHGADGAPTGYMVYQTRDQDAPELGQLFRVKDFVYNDLDAYRGLWEYVLSHDLVGKVHMHGCIGAEDPAPNLLLEPCRLNRWEGDGIWMRIVDVEKGLPQRPYRASGTLNIAVSDSMCDWNNATFRLETDGPSSQVQRNTETTDLTMTPNSLATFVAGARSSTFLCRAGLIEAANQDAVDLADRMFATSYAPHCLNDF